jgi:hypothetical protein
MKMSEKQTRARVVDRDDMPSEVLTLIERIEKMLRRKKRGVAFNALVNVLVHMTLETADSEREVWDTAGQITANLNKGITANLEQYWLEMQRSPSATDVIN